MKYLLSFLLLCSGLAARADFIFDQFIAKAQSLPYEELRGLPLLNNGRIKPLESLAKETSIYLTGSYQFKGLHPIQLLLGLMISDDGENLQLIEVRSPELRKQLGLPTPESRRHYSLKELMSANLESLASALMEKQKVNKRGLTEVENKTIETYEIGRASCRERVYVLV